MASCPECGAAVPPPQGGVGFWDILDGPASDTLAQDHEAQPLGRHAHGGLKTVTAVAGAIVAGACLASSLASGVMSYRSLQSLQSQQAESDGRMSGLETRIDELEGAVRSVEELLTEEADAFRIVSEPLDTTQEVGFTSDDTPLASICAEGDVVSFGWEKLDSTYGWVPLDFDDDGANVALGIALDDDVDNGTSSLIATGLTEESSGTYRCVATDGHGHTLACTFELFLLQDGTPLDALRHLRR